jgi:hypothetical protein
MSDLHDRANQELLNALTQLMARPESAEGLTVMEIMDATGHGENWVRKRLRNLIRDGNAECVQVYRAAIDGRTMQAPAYRLTPAGRAAVGLEAKGEAV